MSRIDDFLLPAIDANPVKCAIILKAGKRDGSRTKSTRRCISL
jgi:hypothetical protein